MKTVRLAIVGFGNAAKAFSQLLIDYREKLQSEGLNVIVTLAATHSRGCLYHEDGLDLEGLLAYEVRTGRIEGYQKADTTLDLLNLLEKAQYDVLVELSTLNIFTGEPAISHIEAAFKRWKHVITANKGPIAWAYKRLRDEAAAKELGFYYETTVMDGTPVFNLYRDTLPFCKVLEVKGILNTTTNFILEHLHRGESLEVIMDEGKRRGFVEADPSLDIDGWDGAAKLTALMNVLMDADLKPTDVKRTGIAEITEADLQEADAAGCTIKLLCRGYFDSGVAKAEVRPERLSKQHLYAGVDETSSVVTLVTDLMGELSIVEHSPEIQQTGYGIFSDLLRLYNSHLK